MLYDLAIDEELDQMESSAALRAWNAHEIQLPLRSLMRPVVMIHISSSTQTAIQLLIEHHVGAAPVVDDENRLRGIFSERDVLRKILNRTVGNLDTLGIEQFMSAAPQTAQPEDTLDTAILYMAHGGYRHLPIVNEQNEPIGMVSIRDVISHLVDEFPQEVLTLPPRPIRDAMKAREGA